MAHHPESSNPASANEEAVRLNRLLRTWQVNTSLPPDFEASVWRRIESSERRSAHVEAESASWPTIWTWIERWLARPRVAVAYLAVLCLLGAGAGSIRGQAESAAAADGLQGQYVRSIDPFFPGTVR